MLLSLSIIIGINDVNMTKLLFKICREMMLKTYFIFKFSSLTGEVQQFPITLINYNTSVRDSSIRLSDPLTFCSFWRKPILAYKNINI